MSLPALPFCHALWPQARRSPAAILKPGLLKRLAPLLLLFVLLPDPCRNVHAADTRNAPPGVDHIMESGISAIRGSLPLLLTVPHDGDMRLPGVAARTRGTVVRDADTAALAERVAAHLEHKLGRRPYVLIARISRSQLDVNRPADEAMESAAVMPAYRLYHDTLAAYVAELQQAHPGGALLLDIHGQSGQPDTIFRGTRAGLTTRALLRRFGPGALQGPDSLTGQLAARGYLVHPATDASSLAEDRRYNGGYTVYTHGSHRPGGVDAIQLEFGRTSRNQNHLPEDLADALIHFLRSHAMLAP